MSFKQKLLLNNRVKLGNVDDAKFRCKNCGNTDINFLTLKDHERKLKLSCLNDGCNAGATTLFTDISRKDVFGYEEITGSHVSEFSRNYPDLFDGIHNLTRSGYV